MIDPALREAALDTVGFMPPEEGDALHEAAIDAGRSCPGKPFVEVGSYCGRSTIWLGAAARASNTVLFAVDHHRGSEENQPGWDFHDPTLVDPESGKIDTLPHFRRTIHGTGLEDSVIAVVGSSPVIAAHWKTPCAFVFIDGGHGVEPARADYRGWAPHVAPSGTLAIHDVFVDPAHGGRPPYEDIYLPAMRSGWFEEVSMCGSLRVLRRLDRWAVARERIRRGLRRRDGD
jgi:MMP 1-O-methyltransferase